ncbi:T9SS type B sorting domain-containing protein [Polaribacter haliotis]|uniref:T9SS type B sorting domain-containing protein n=1 Tax=Polaribacter haliotis TaxID=1888915 RepID=A0A7L8AHY9_9FLAO|nr:T9SS type B sorting domain-containing protein [Polaribacter haliotis]QOD61622.1 T9SS type B sorting domain-containing protein [Polaribacter haliotis]
MKNYLILFILFFTLNIFSQNETNHWLFGNNAHVVFSNEDDNLTVLNDSKTSSSKGSASISDKNGDLLFYTNGINVWNKKHQRMLGSSGISLIANDIEAQNSIIIPKPNSNNIYYIFTIKTVDPENDINSANAGLYYSIVDISKNNNLGLLIETNILIKKNVVGKISAVHHKNGKDIWVLTNGKKTETEDYYDVFYSFLIDSSGVIKDPVVSENGDIFIFDSLGELKLSPNGEKVVYAANDSGAFVFDFNSNNGIVSNPKRLSLATSPGDNSFPYGATFSIDSNIIYLEALDNSDNSRLYQFDLENSGSSNFINFSFIINLNKNRGALQLARNGKIYYATNSGEGFFEGLEFLNVINNPLGKDRNEINFQQNSVNLLEGKSRFGLPNFIQSYFRTRILNEKGCENSAVNFIVDTYTDIQDADWDFGDGNTSTLINPNHTYNSPGKYIVKTTVRINNSLIKLKKEIEIFAQPEVQSGKSLKQCDTDNDGISLFDLTDIKTEITDIDNKLIFYKDNADLISDKPIINPEGYENESNPQNIIVKVINKNGCSNITNFTIETLFVQLNNIDPIFTCEDSDGISGNNMGVFSLAEKRKSIKTNLNLSNDTTLKFYSNPKDAQLTKDELPDDYQSITTTIWVRADNASGCGGIQSFNATVNSQPIINLIDSYTICFNPSLKPPIILSADVSSEKNEWRNSLGTIISTAKDFTLTNTGIYSLTSYNTENGIECSYTKEFEVINPESAVFSDVLVNTEDETNNTLEIFIDGNSTYEFSLDNNIFFGNSNNYTFTKVTPGLRTVYVRDINNCETPIQQKVSVLGTKKFFTPNGDGKNDYWNIRGLDPNFFKSINIVIFNRYGRIVASINDFNSPGWDGTFNGKMLISNNYWFTVEIIDMDDNVIKKTGNFALIRK